jgi:N-acetyl-anhydromuramoyl-L-alanine amidase
MILRPLPHWNERPAGMLIDTLVVHSMTPGESCSPEECVQLLDQHEVAAHYFITREGELWQSVSEEKRAWHAGESCLPFSDDSRVGVNDFSIGVELITPPDHTFLDVQYLALEKLIREIATRYPLRNIVGHDHIAPQRKTDPGIHFDWGKLKALCSDLKLRFSA